MGVKFKTVNGREQVEYQNKEGAVAKFTGFQRVLPVPLLLEDLTGNLF